MKAVSEGTEERWRVVSAEFEQSATRIDNAPAPDLPEVAVAGRSNVGKSSLLNAFAHRRGLARVSRTPGRTRLLNFFVVRLRGPGGDLKFRWIDLPGYGFAQAARPVREAFGPMIEGYLAERDVLRGMVLLVDARRGMRDGEMDVLEYMSARSLPTLLCATKTDKLSASERGILGKKIVAPLREAGVPIDPRDVVLTSALKGTGLGDDPRRGGLARELAELVADPPPDQDRP